MLIRFATYFTGMTERMGRLVCRIMVARRGWEGVQPPPAPRVRTVGEKRGGIGRGRHMWRGAEICQYCQDMGINMWDGVWRRAGEQALPPRGDG